MSIPLSAALLPAAGTGEALNVNGDPYPLYGISMMFRTSRFDVGAQFDNLSAGTFRGPTRTRQLGARTRLLAAVRWRGFESSWGALFTGLGVGIMFFNHHDDLLNNVEGVAGAPAGAVHSGTDRYNSGFTFNLGGGLMFYPFRYLIILVEAELAGMGTSVTAGGLEVDYAGLRLQVNLGLELRVF